MSDDQLQLFVAPKRPPSRYAYNDSTDYGAALYNLLEDLRQASDRSAKIEYVINVFKTLPGGIAANLVMEAVTKAKYNSYASILLAALAGTIPFTIPSAAWWFTREYLKRKRFPINNPDYPTVGLGTDFSNASNIDGDQKAINELNSLASIGDYRMIAFAVGRYALGIFILFSTFLYLAGLTTTASEKIADHVKQHAHDGIEISVNIYLKTILSLLLTAFTYLMLGLAFKLPITSIKLAQIGCSLEGFGMAGIIGPTTAAGRVLLGPALATAGAALPSPVKWIAEKAAGSATGPISFAIVYAIICAFIGGVCGAVIGEAAKNGVGAAYGAGAGVAGGAVVGAVAGAVRHLMFSNPERRGYVRIDTDDNKSCLSRCCP